MMPNRYDMRSSAAHRCTLTTLAEMRSVLSRSHSRSSRPPRAFGDRGAQFAPVGVNRRRTSSCRDAHECWCRERLGAGQSGQRRRGWRVKARLREMTNQRYTLSDAVRMTQFDALACTYGNLLLHTARLLTDDEWTAEEVVQGSLTWVWQQRDAPRDPSLLRIWLIQILVQQTRRRWSLFARIRAWRANVATQGGGVSSRENASLALRAAIRRLSPEQRRVLVLRDYLALSEDEIAVLLHRSPTTIQRSLATALQQLRARIAQTPRHA